MLNEFPAKQSSGSGLWHLVM